MTGSVRADGGIVWLIVGVFWVIAQIAGAAAKKNQTRPPRPDAGEEQTPPADPIAELLRKMAGVEEFRVEPPAPVEAQEQEPVFVRESPWKPGEIEALPDIKPLRRAAPEPPVPVAAQPEAAVRPKMSAFRNNILSIKLPAMNLSFHGSETSVRKAPNLGSVLSLSDKTSLRRAMLSHVIFSPPKALEQAAKQQLP